MRWPSGAGSPRSSTGCRRSSSSTSWRSGCGTGRRRSSRTMSLRHALNRDHVPACAEATAIAASVASARSTPSPAGARVGAPSSPTASANRSDPSSATPAAASAGSGGRPVVFASASERRHDRSVRARRKASAEAGPASGIEQPSLGEPGREGGRRPEIVLRPLRDLRVDEVLQEVEGSRRGSPAGWLEPGHDAKVRIGPTACQHRQISKRRCR